MVPDFDWVQDHDGDLRPMVAQVRRAIAWVARNAEKFGGDPDRIYLSGHSSGAHLAGVALTTDWDRDFSLPSDHRKGGTAVQRDVRPQAGPAICQEFLCHNH